MLRTVLCLFVLNNLFLLCISLGMLGPANILYKKFGHCDPPVTEMNMWITQRKYNRTTHVLDITMSSPYELSDDIILDIKSSIKKEGGYQQAFALKDGFCKALGTLFGDLFEEFLKLNGLDDCPIPAGEYEILDFFLDNEKLSSPMLYGEYKNEVLLLKDNLVKGCYIALLEVLPR